MTFDRAIIFREIWLNALNHYARGLAEQCDELVGFWERLEHWLPERDKQRLIGLSLDDWPPTIQTTMQPVYADPSLHVQVAPDHGSLRGRAHQVRGDGPKQEELAQDEEDPEG